MIFGDFFHFELYL